jgi:TadE-like protein
MRKRPTIIERVRRFVRREQGTQLVELAIALPLMLVLLAGVAEFGRLFYTYSTLTNAVRAGAREASKWERNASWMTGTCAQPQRIVVYGEAWCGGTAPPPILPGLTEANVTVVPNGASVNNIQSVTVSIVGYQYQPLFDLGRLTGIPALSLRINLNANATMHQLYNGPTAG